MYAIHGNIYHQYTPNVSIYTSTMDPMGMINSGLSHFHMSNRKNPGNTKHVFVGHWLMEIDGNCSKHEVSDGTFPD